MRVISISPTGDIDISLLQPVDNKKIEVLLANNLSYGVHVTVICFVVFSHVSRFVSKQPQSISRRIDTLPELGVAAVGSDHRMPAFKIVLPTPIG